MGAQVEEVLAGGGVEADDGDFHGRTALHLAASNGHLATVRRLVLGARPIRSGIQGLSSKEGQRHWQVLHLAKLSSQSLLSTARAVECLQRTLERLQRRSMRLSALMQVS